MEKLTSVPKDFAVCTLPDCAHAADCLRHKAYDALADLADRLYAVNPRRCRPRGRCPYRKPLQTLVLVRGFSNIKEQLLPRQYAAFSKYLIDRMGRTLFYRCQRGVRFLSPEEKAAVENALKCTGSTLEMTYDHTEEQIDWRD